MTTAKMKDMAREYIRQRNPNGMIAIVPHFDKDHYHFHVCASGVEFKSGKSIRLSKIDLQTLKKGMQGYQCENYPEFKKSIAGHNGKNRSNISDKEYQFKRRTGRQTQKEQLLLLLENCFKKANSRNTLLNLLRQYNLETNNRAGRLNGIIFNGLKFRFSNLGFRKDMFDELRKLTKRKRNLSYLRKGVQEKER